MWMWLTVQGSVVAVLLSSQMIYLCSVREIDDDRCEKGSSSEGGHMLVVWRDLLVIFEIKKKICWLMENGHSGVK